MNEFDKWLNKKVKIFVGNLSNTPIVYTANVIAVGENFVTIVDKIGTHIDINIKNVIQIWEEEDNYRPSFYQP